MAYNSRYQDTQEDKTLEWDLRQFRAKLISGHMLDIYKARQLKNYVRWFQAIDDLYTVVEHTLISKHEDIRKQYLKRRDKAAIIFNHFSTIYLGQVYEAKGVYNVEETLKQLERFLYAKMEECHVFGGSDYEPGLS